MIYLAVFASSLMLYVLSEGSPNFRRLAYFGFLIFLFLFTAFRVEVGCDYGSYYNHTIDHQHETFAEAINKSEQLYWLLIISLRRLGFEFPAINVVSAAVFFFGVHSIARRQPNPLYFLILIFPILITGIAMSAVRQAFAIGILCFAFGKLKNKKAISYLILVFIASGFHESAFIFAPLVFILSNYNFKVRLFLVCLILPIFSIYILQYSFGQRYSNAYIDSGIVADGAVYRTSSLAISALIFLVFMKKNWQKFYLKEYNFAYYISIAALLLPFLSLYSSVIADRFGYYLMVPQAMILNRYSVIFHGWERRIFAIVPIAMLGTMLVFWSQYSGLFFICYETYDFWIPFTGYTI